MRHFVFRRLVSLLCASSLIGFSSQGIASGFQIWEQDGAGVANFHAGYAAWANDASTAFYNPAGITRIKNQQLVLGGAAIMSDFKYTGTIQVSTVIDPLTGFPIVMPTVAQGGEFCFVPNLHYVAPITDRIGFGFSIVVPFGLKTDYGRNTPAQYAATLSSVRLIDVSPDIAFEITDQASFGVGFDIQKMDARFNQVAVAPLFGPDGITLLNNNATNTANDTAYGYHLGALYQFTPNARVGVSYHSQVVHHLTGDSKFSGPLVPILTDDTLSTIKSTHAKTNVTIPPYTSLSAYYRWNPCWAVMGTVSYTQWSVFKNLKLQNVAGVNTDFQTTTSLVIVVPQFFKNTWNFALGLDYYLSDRFTLRGGLGYDQSPISNTYRNLPLPDTNRYVFALGGHYQATKCLGFDLGWMHLYVKEIKVSPPPQVMGPETVTTRGKVNGLADVIGGQVTWDIT